MTLFRLQLHNCLWLSMGFIMAVVNRLEMWQRADPDHPSLQSFRDQIDHRGNWRDRRQR
jgi:hypothetical protein